MAPSMLYDRPKASLLVLRSTRLIMVLLMWWQWHCHMLHGKHDLPARALND